MQPEGKQYAFVIDGYRFSFTVDPKSQIGRHPLDVLEQDLIEIVALVHKLERVDPQKILPPGPGGVTMENLLAGDEPPNELSP